MHSPRDTSVQQHYGHDALVDAIYAGLERLGKPRSSLTPDDLAPVDAIHIGGRGATVALLEEADLQAGGRVLDVGSGIGGTARYLACRGFEVMGIDLTPLYCRLATELSAMVGLADRTRFEVASALELPFPENSFDVVWTEHVQMNIEDKGRFYAEATRVLRPGGKLVFHDIFAGGGGPPHFPLPWADDPSISALWSPDAVQALLTGELGLTVERWADTTESSRAFFEDMLARVQAEGLPPLGLHLLMGPSTEIKLRNLLANLAERRTLSVRAVLRAPR